MIRAVGQPIAGHRALFETLRIERERSGDDLEGQFPGAFDGQRGAGLVILDAHTPAEYARDGVQYRQHGRRLTGPFEADAILVQR